ncbi:glycosyltransferase [Rhodopseudomonas sp. P2A-2r]|uniref:glycosyltransferase n=1 Tax=unclassified Rhodopseudomonas TaxID=2638247 RepID=UPI002234614B|nr:glycosyltransferase [Rhodopseudomonas sp. P2A-2r]UZE48044.1 glycosyltransferase [Rhodopseudomonas sp. P2A-2r]
MPAELAAVVNFTGGAVSECGSATDGTKSEQQHLLITVIIPHLNQPEGLRECLESLAEQSLSADRFEVIVIDNGSTSLPTTIVASYTGARLLHEARPGPGLARNAGARAAGGEILAFIDADCRAHPDWLASIQAAFRHAGPGQILGGDVQIWRDPSQPITGIEAYESIFAYRFKLYIEQHGYCGTGNLAVRRTEFDEVGPFAGLCVAEDMQWGQRASARGFKFNYVSDMIVYHPARRTLEELRLKWDRQICHYFNMAEGTPAWRWRWALRALLILISPFRDFPKVLLTSRIQGFPARLKGCAILCAIRVHRARRMLQMLFGDRAIVWNRETKI